MKSGTVSVRYSKAMLLYAEEQGCQTEVYDRMDLLSTAFRQVPQLMEKLKNPTLSGSDKVRLLIAAVTGADGQEVCKPLQDFIALVVKSGRVATLPFIAKTYRNLYRERYNIVPVELTVATPLDDAHRDELKKFISSELHSTMEWTEKVDPDIMGGFVLQVDDIRMDASVARRLWVIEKELIEKNSRII